MSTRKGPIAPDEIIAVNAKIYKQFASVTKSNLDLLSLIHQLFEYCIGDLAMVVRDHKGWPRLHLVHGIRCFLPSITGLLHPSPHQRSTFGYFDDVDDGGDGTLVQLTSDLLAFTGGVKVWPREHHRVALTAATDDNRLPALGDLPPGTKIISARKLMFVPFPVMHLLLVRNLSPRQAFIIFISRK